MRYPRLILLAALLLPLPALPLPALARTHVLSITRAADGLYLMYYDSTAGKPSITKSTVVEFEDYIALLEVPTVTSGGSGRLNDDVEGGEAAIEALGSYFPAKPLRYVLSTHWHPHSLSTILPFISRGITVVTTRDNFARLRQMLDSAGYARYGGFIRFVEGDSMTIADRTNSIVAYRIDRATYPNIPTQDFLYFSLPKYDCLHCSCMFQRLGMMRGKELISSRVEDLVKFTRARHIVPRYIITTDTYWDDASGMVSGDTLRTMLARGITMSAIDAEIQGIDEQTLILRSDSIILGLMKDGIPATYLNRAVYTLLGRKELTKALAMARLQALLLPSDPNSWDTYGEVYWFLGETALAKRYEAQSRRIDANFKAGGEEAWKRDLEEYRKKWESR
jgi:hypothetical protein